MPDFSPEVASVNSLVYAVEMKSNWPITPVRKTAAWITSSIAAIAVGCASALVPPLPAPQVCRDAGFTDAEIDATAPLYEVARQNGATLEEVQEDNRMACTACEDPTTGCDETLCLECFDLLASSAFEQDEMSDNDGAVSEQ